jgi:glycosyltransferase involved in cell wall biosynthesis
MLNGQKIAVVVPAYNEEVQIALVISSMPDFVDRIVVVNDRSTDETARVVERYIAEDKTLIIELKPFPNEVVPNLYNRAEQVVDAINRSEIKHYIPSEVANKYPERDRIILINHLENGGVGAAISRGYKWCKDHAIDCTAVMAGDGQMDPEELESICAPVANGEVDYAKGNRLIHASAKYVIPKIRLFGNSVLSMLTKIASGYWRVSDTQTGYTAISLKAMHKVRLHDIYKRYGMPNDLLVKLNIAQCTIKEVEIKPIYEVGEKSKMRIMLVIPTVSLLLLRSFFKRIYIKYLLRDFHPLCLFYHSSFLLGLAALPYAYKIAKAFATGQIVHYEPLFAFIFLTTSSFQALIFAMWMDIQDNERLFKSASE